MAYDLDRESITAFKIPCFWREMNPRARILPVVSLQFHPKDIGRLLIGYTEGAVIYSFKQNKPVMFYRYEVPPGAPGGDAHPMKMNSIRNPRLTHAIWHPTGTFILTAHDDSSLVFWDVNRDGRAIAARTIQEIDINVPGSGQAHSTKSPTSSTTAGISIKEPYTHISWCSKENPDDTGLLVSGGSPTTNPTNGLTFIDLGPTPAYQTSSWDYLANHFRSPKRTHVLPTPPNAQITNFCLVPRSSPHFAGSHDPIAILITLSSGELLTLSFPSGHPISPTNMLHVSLSFVHPFVTKTALAYVDRTRWLGLREVRQHGPMFLRGGVEGTKPLKRFENRNIVQTAHADGTVRVWDAGHGDEIENGGVLQADLARAVGRWDNIEVTKMDFSGSAGEMSVGLRTGEVVVFRLNRNKNAGRPPVEGEKNAAPGQMTDISMRVDSGLQEGLLPHTLTNDQQGPVTALEHSDVGFIATGYASGGITIIDLRGPAIIHTALISDLISKHSIGKRSSVNVRKSNSQTQSSEYPTAMEFGVMTMEGEDYSSIALFVGTSKGHVATFKILPSQSGRYSAQCAGVTHLSEDRVISLSPIDSRTGAPAYATGPAVGGLAQGQRTDGVVVATCASSAHIFKPAHSKGASKHFDNGFCDTARVAQYEGRGFALVGLFGDGTVRAYSLPALKELGGQRINHVLDTQRFSEAIITPTGDVFGWTGPSEVAILNTFGTGVVLPPSSDRLYDPAKPPPIRPTISNLQWIAGTQYITPADLDILIGGPDRPPSKRMVAEMRATQDAEFQRQREAARSGRAAPPDPSQEGWGAYMQRQIQERTEQLGLTENSMERTAESSNNFSESVSDYIKKQKRQAATSYITSKFGF